MIFPPQIRERLLWTRHLAVVPQPRMFPTLIGGLVLVTFLCAMVGEWLVALFAFSFGALVSFAVVGVLVKRDLAEIAASAAQKRRAGVFMAEIADKERE